MNLLKHLQKQPFIVATGTAALIHSTWALGTFFSAEQPHDAIPLILWLIPALLIAFSLDIGQIVTSAEIRAGQRAKAKYLTFAVFAAATYFLQFVYCAAHMPAIALAAGVRPEWASVIGFIRDSAVFVVPALLPLSTLLYTFSQEHTAPVQEPAPPVEMATPSSALVLVPSDHPEQITIEKRLESAEKIEVECHEPGCNWAGAYESVRAGQNALHAHQRKHPALTLSDNGHRE